MGQINLTQSLHGAFARKMADAVLAPNRQAVRRGEYSLLLPSSSAGCPSARLIACWAGAVSWTGFHRAHSGQTHHPFRSSAAPDQDTSRPATSDCGQMLPFPQLAQRARPSWPTGPTWPVNYTGNWSRSRQAANGTRLATRVGHEDTRAPHVKVCSWWRSTSLIPIPNQVARFSVVYATDRFGSEISLNRNGTRLVFPQYVTHYLQRHK